MKYILTGLLLAFNIATICTHPDFIDKKGDVITLQ